MIYALIEKRYLTDAVYQSNAIVFAKLATLVAKVTWQIYQKNAPLR